MWGESRAERRAGGGGLTPASPESQTRLPRGATPLCPTAKGRAGEPPRGAANFPRPLVGSRPGSGELGALETTPGGGRASDGVNGGGKMMRGKMPQTARRRACYPRPEWMPHSPTSGRGPPGRGRAPGAAARCRWCGRVVPGQGRRGRALPLHLPPASPAPGALRWTGSG